MHQPIPVVPVDVESEDSQEYALEYSNADEEKKAAQQEVDAADRCESDYSDAYRDINPKIVTEEKSCQADLC